MATHAELYGSYGPEQVLLNYINLKLAALGEAPSRSSADPWLLEVAAPLLRNHAQKEQLLAGSLCPVDARIQAFLDSYLAGVCPSSAPRLPSPTLVLDRPGLARILSVPADGDHFSSRYIDSYRVAQGVLHNPRSDRRTTKGVFHIVEGGLPIPYDKVPVPVETFARLLEIALNPPPEVLLLPFSGGGKPIHVWTSLMLRPLVCPSTGRDEATTMETRFFAPGSLVASLDFVEAIFGNAGDPHLPENDAALDPLHWTGHTGCVILAPHLLGVPKRALGLPHWNEATDDQRRRGLCWTDESEPYNEGNAFKIACRDARGVMVTIIADSYFGYCKKEVKTQISFAANLFGLAEEEHAGGALAFATYVLGQDFIANRTVPLKQTTLERALEVLGPLAVPQPEGYAVDARYSRVLYICENSEFSVRNGKVRWPHDGGWRELTLRPDYHYVLPSGYRVTLQKQIGGTMWRLIGTQADGTLCHKPCTVSGGGKSEISKSISNVILQGPVFVRDYHSDMEAAAQIIAKDFSNIYRDRTPDSRTRRLILSSERSLGSVIKLLTPSPDYNDEYNRWLRSIPQTVRQLVFTIKRYYRPEWGDNWRQHLTVDSVNGRLGHELKYNDQKLVGNYLRVGYDADGSWRIFKLRPDFHPADKVQMEDDITASVVVPASYLPDLPDQTRQSVKLVANCETMLFQRPDDAIHRGLDAQTEADLAGPDVFLSNFEPLIRAEARAIADHVVEFDKYTKPMQQLLGDFLLRPDPQYVVSSAHPRLVDGKPSKNPRYLQRRPDLVNPQGTHLAKVCTRLHREVPIDIAVHLPIDAVLPARRNNPPDPKIGLPPLAVYNPIHWQELPELFMDYVSSLTGKSPSTTGFGSEGALTKGPFNALWPVVDLNNALVAAILTGFSGFTTATGYLGPRVRVDHDITLLVPEIWCRMKPHERTPSYLIENGYLEKIEDFEFEGRQVLASRLGYRITALFADHFLGRLFETPDAVFTREMLCPEEQDRGAFVAGMDAIVASQREVACSYFADRSIEGACPPLRALLHIMAYGEYEGITAGAAALKAMFTRENLLASEWYAERLREKQRRDISLWERHAAAAEAAVRDRAVHRLRPSESSPDSLLALTRAKLAEVRSDAYLDGLRGTIGADPLRGQLLHVHAAT